MVSIHIEGAGRMKPFVLIFDMILEQDRFNDTTGTKFLGTATVQLSFSDNE